MIFQSANKVTDKKAFIELISIYIRIVEVIAAEHNLTIPMSKISDASLAEMIDMGVLESGDDAPALKKLLGNVNCEIFKRLAPGEDSTNPKIADIMPYAHRNGWFKDKYYKLFADRPCHTIIAHLRMDCLSYIHPSQIRSITPREAARVQSFPDDYLFLGAYLKTYMQIGNAVPVKLAKAIGDGIMKFVK